uniref:Uncharacterized protein n=1 Tax=Rhizophora mucronata TaxID=61149 RepID=A0A2P2K8C9_RHIMU
MFRIVIDMSINPSRFYRRLCCMRRNN